MARPPLRRPNSSSHPLRGGCLTRSATVRERERIESEMLRSCLDGDLDGAADAVFTDGAGNERRLKLKRTRPRGNPARFGNLPETRVWMEARRIGDDVGYIRFNLFLDPEALMPRFERAVRDCLKCSGMIDLRGNPGGIGVMAMGMSGWFVGRFGLRQGTLESRDFTWDFEVLPRAETFDGSLAILVDGRSASTAEIFAAGLHDLGRARIFGTPTAGAALPSEIVRLPNGDGFQFATANYVSRSGKALEGVGVTPDVMVRHSREGLLAGRDLPLDAAVNWIKKGR